MCHRSWGLRSSVVAAIGQRQRRLRLSIVINSRAGSVVDARVQRKECDSAPRSLGNTCTPTRSLWCDAVAAALPHLTIFLLLKYPIFWTNENSSHFFMQLHLTLNMLRWEFETHFVDYKEIQWYFSHNVLTVVFKDCYVRHTQCNLDPLCYEN